MANSDVTFEHPLYVEHRHQLELVHTIYNGIDTANSLLNQLPNEYVDSFNTRVTEATLDNYVERIVTTMAGQVNRKDISFEDVSDDIVDAMNTVAGSENLNQFAKDISESAIKDGKSYILVDMGVASAEPMFYQIHRSQLINWRKNDNDEFTLAVIAEAYVVEDGRFGMEYKEQYRVIDEQGNVQIWRASADGKNTWHIVEEYNTSYDFLPLYEINIDDIPPLYDIAKINAKHMNFTSLRDRFLKEALDPILFGQNLGISDEGSEDNPTIILGVNQMMSTDNPDSNLSWVELDGKNYDISEKHLSKLEEDMASRALKLQGETQIKTATQVNQEDKESTSRLSTIATELENGINSAINAYSLMKYSKELDGNAIINRDFDSVAIDSNALTALNTLQVSGNLSKKTLLKAINDSEYVEIEDIDDELAMIEDEVVEVEDVGVEQSFTK